MGGGNPNNCFYDAKVEKKFYTFTRSDLTFSVFFFSVSVFLRLNGC